MSSTRLPRVLVIDVNAWRKDAPSNTLMEIFRAWDPQRLALIYTSSELPDSEVCAHYFQISESQVLKSLLRPFVQTGREVVNTGNNDNGDIRLERSLRKRAHASHPKWMRLAREWVWKFGRWKTRELDAFIDAFQPDVLFIPIFPYAYMGRIQQYVLKRVRRPFAAYLSDDNYSFRACSGVTGYLLRLWNRKYVKSLAVSSNEMFVIVEKGKEETDRLFGTDSVILTKGIDFSKLSFRERTVSLPLKFVYTGSLLIGRGETLELLAQALDELNAEYGRLAGELYIYSQTSPPASILSRLERGASHFCGAVPHRQIADVVAGADVVVFAESLKGKKADIARLSFSTKITDYLSGGKCILAIGKDDIAPMDYFRRNQAALIAVSPAEVKSRIRELMDNPSLVNEFGRKAFMCAGRNHDQKMMAERFVQTMVRASGSGVKNGTASGPRKKNRCNE